MILVEANVLLYAEDQQSPHHVMARKWWEAQFNDHEVNRCFWISCAKHCVSGHMFDPISGIFFSRVNTQFASLILKIKTNGGMLSMKKRSFALMKIKTFCFTILFHRRNGGRLSD